MKNNHNVTPLCGTPTLCGVKPSNLTVDSPVGFDPANSTGVNPTGCGLTGYQKLTGAFWGGALVGGLGEIRLGGTLVGKALLVIALIGIMLAGCNDSGSGSGGGNGNGNGGGNGSGDTTGRYTCANGTPENGSPDGTADVEDCKSCRTNYVLIHGNRCVRRGTYTCTNGTAATGSPDGTTDVERCMVCQSNYFRDVLGRCSAKGSYTCANGTPATGSPSGATNVERCASCHTNYFRDAAGRCVTCASTLAGPSDATHDINFLCGAYTQVKVNLSNEKNYIIYTNLSATNHTVTLSNAQNQTEYMQACPYSAPGVVTETACASPPSGTQRWVIMPLESGTHTLSVVNTTNSSGGSYKLLVQEHQDYVHPSLPRLPLEQSLIINTGDPYHFWTHFPPNKHLQTRLVNKKDSTGGCGVVHKLIGRVDAMGNPLFSTRFYSSVNTTWLYLGETGALRARYNTSTFGIIQLADDGIGGPAPDCQLQIRFQ